MVDSLYRVVDSLYRVVDSIYIVEDYLYRVAMAIGDCDGTFDL